MLMRVSRVARLEANYEAMQKQAASAGSMNKTLLDENTALKKVREKLTKFTYSFCFYV